MLAAAALHMSCFSQTKEDQEALREIAATQMNTGMEQYRSEVRNVTTTNAEALFAFSAMITTYVLRTAGDECKAALQSMTGSESLQRINDVSISSLSHTLCGVFRSMRGVLVIWVPCLEQIQRGPLQPVVRRDWWPQPVPVTSAQIADDEKLRHLEKLWSRPGRSYEYSFDTLRRALKDLREAFAIVFRLIDTAQNQRTTEQGVFDWASILNWLIELAPEFLALLEERQMEAWVLVAHYAILTKVTDVVWLDGWAMNLITVAALVIGETNWEWIEWPASAIGFDLATLRGSMGPSVSTTHGQISAA
ncbi:hypothetical protein NX059_010397 [Plenodomus lindquistii]|nr:hypothetical protein NX059_010397 [Plenodomus lindquistii]